MPLSDINVICLKWGDKYGPEYVNRLASSVRRHCDVPVRFWCFTDDTNGISPEVECHALPYARDLESWWNKLWLFSAESPIPKNQIVFYVDLDTLITSNITDIVCHRATNIVVLRDFYHGIARTAGVMGSGLMSWQSGSNFDIWHEFWRDPQAAMSAIIPLGDQKWIEKITQGRRQYWQDLFPDRVVSFKVHCRRGLPQDASIVCYHGRPSIPDSATQSTKDWKWQLDPQPWVLDHWRI